MTRLRGCLAGRSPWEPREIETLRESYARGGIEAARVALPYRSASALFHKAERVHVMRRRRWTIEDDARLRRLWDAETTLRQIAKQMGRSEATTYWRAQKLGLKLGCPDGWEYLTHAAKRAGFGTVQLRRILRWAGVAIRRAITRPGAKRRGRPGAGRLTYVVAPGDVDAAVESWLETETLERAARRNGICGETLARRLRAIGIDKQVRGKRKRHWRVHPHDVARALSAVSP